MVRVEELPQLITNRKISETGTESTDTPKDEGNQMEEIEGLLDVSTGLQGLTEDDFSSTEQESDAATEAIEWEKLETQKNTRNANEKCMINEWLKVTNRNVDKKERKGLVEETTAGQNDIEKKARAVYRVDDSMEGNSSARIQENPLFFRGRLMANTDFPTFVGFTRKAARRLSAVKFSKLSRNTPVWKEYCEQRVVDTVKGCIAT